LQRRMLLSVTVIFLFILSGIFLSTLGAASTSALSSQPVLPQAPNIEPANRTVYMSLWLIDIYSFDYRTGNYIFDFYVFFHWTDPNITIDWYLRNGYPTYPGAKLLVDSSYNNTVKWEHYRVRASLNYPIEGRNYPFDTIRLVISAELLTHDYDTTLVWLQSATGIDAQYKNVGWSDPSFETATSISHYPIGIDSPRADMYIVQNRNPFGAIIKTILPPIIFCIVSLASFLFQMHESSAFSLRVGINTSMLISAVLFNIAEQSNIPPITQLSLYNIFSASVTSFLALSLVITVIGYVEWMRHQDKTHVSKVNKLGVILSVALPVALFLILLTLK
jgi:hypothetical protein